MNVDDLIRQHRTAEATVTLTAGGEPLANAEVTVAQTRHKFLFGSTGFEFIPLANGEVHGEERAEPGAQLPHVLRGDVKHQGVHRPRSPPLAPRTRTHSFRKKYGKAGPVSPT